MIKKQIAITAISALLISSCAMPSIEATKDAIQNKKDEILQQYQKTNNDPSRGLISFNDKPYLGSKAFVIAKQAKPLPDIFSQKLNMNNHTAKSLTDYVNSLSNLINLNIMITDEAQEWLLTDKTNSNQTDSSNKTPNNK